MRFLLDAEQRAFADSLTAMLTASDTPSVVRDWSRGDHTTGRALWRRIAEAGVFALAVPEAYAGMGPRPVELAVAFVELGRHAVPGPLVETVTAATLLAALDDTGPSKRLLPALASGESTATLAWGPYALDADMADVRLTVSTPDRVPEPMPMPQPGSGSPQEGRRRPGGGTAQEGPRGAGGGTAQEGPRGPGDGTAQEGPRGPGGGTAQEGPRGPGDGTAQEGPPGSGGGSPQKGARGTARPAPTHPQPHNHRPHLAPPTTATLHLAPPPGPPHPSLDPARHLTPLPPGGELLATGPQVAAAAAHALTTARLVTAAQALGIGLALLDKTVAHVKRRTQFGTPIGSFQAVKHRMADAKIALEFARPLLFGAALTMTPRDVAAAKVTACEAAYATARTALQLHGAIGYTAEYDLSLWLTKARVLRTAWGDPEQCRAAVLHDRLSGDRRW